MSLRTLLATVIAAFWALSYIAALVGGGEHAYQLTVESTPALTVAIGYLLIVDRKEKKNGDGP